MNLNNLQTENDFIGRWKEKLLRTKLRNPAPLEPVCEWPHKRGEEVCNQCR